MAPVESIMRLAPIGGPDWTPIDTRDARPLAEALVRGGLKALEVTLRTPAALEVIQEMAGVAGATVGAGTVLNEADLRKALDAGAKFIVSPGLGIINANLVGGQLMLDQFIFDTLVGQRPGGVEAERLEVARQDPCSTRPAGRCGR